ncbi:MAG: EAL domain-containing protein, partial [Burkholderiaceae bacterium]
AAVQLIGAPDAVTLLGRSIVDFIHPQHRAMLAARVSRLDHGADDMPMQEWRYLRLDGKAIDVQAQASRVSMNGSQAIQVSFMDITARKQAEEQLRENEARFRALTSLSSDWYWEQDEQFRFVSVRGEHAEWTEVANQPFVRDGYLGRTRWELGETHLTQAQWEQHRADLLAHREFRNLTMRFDTPGGVRWASIGGTPIVDAHGVFRGYRGIGRDITAEKEAQEQINALAFYDALTGLPNRRLLIEQLKQALVTHARSQQYAALLFIDLDNFKTLNDTLGHETGDLLLQQVARRLLSCVREADSVARLGGDEFVVMLQGLSALALHAASDAESVGHKIIDAFAPPFTLAGREYRSTPSIGVTLFGRDGQGVEDLLKQADLAMYQAKAAGRNTLRMFDEGMQAAVDARAAMETDLRQALEQRQFVLHYQPVVNKQGSVSGAEALVRWQHPSRGLVSPGHFIPIAESTRLIVPLGAWVLDNACAQLASWGARDATRHLTMAVNVSAHQFMEPDFVAQVEAALERNGADPAALKLELTESLLADNLKEVIAKMTALRARGVAFSLDDFGTGYSSLSYLKLLPLAHLKIDQSFVRDLLVDPNDAAIARTIVALGGSLGLAVIAEGVETDGQHRFLLAIGCETFQGYLFARPVPIAAFEALLLLPLPRPPPDTDG